jgi:hypothetical protein
MTAMTLEDARQITGTNFYDYLDAQAEVPVVTRAACQGDVSLLRVTTAAASTPIPAAGIVVAQSGQGGHAHTITGAGMFDRAAQRSGSLVIGQLTVPVGVDVLISHAEHGALLIAPGTYSIGSQREYAGEWRRVAD